MHTCDGAFDFKIPQGRVQNLERYLGKPLTMGVRAENIVVGLGQYLGKFELPEVVGSDTHLHITAEKIPLTAKVSSNEKMETNVPINFDVDMNKIHLI